MQRLANIAEIRTGFPFRGRVIDDPEGTLAVVQLRDISDFGHLEVQGCPHIKEVPAHHRHLLQQGDVLLQSRGTRFPAGLVDVPVHGIAALGLHVIRPSETVLAGYLAWVMNHPTTREALQTLVRGSTIPFLSKTDLALLQIPVPALKLQERIVEVARLEREVARLSEQLQSLNNQYSAAVTWRAATSK